MAQVLRCRIEGEPPKGSKEVFRILTAFLTKEDKHKEANEQSPLTYIYNKNGISTATDGNRIIRMQTDLEDGLLNRKLDWMPFDSVRHVGKPYPIERVNAVIEANRQADTQANVNYDKLMEWYAIIWNTLRYTSPAVRSALRVKFPFSEKYFRARPLLPLFRAIQHIQPKGLVRATCVLAFKERIAFLDMPGNVVCWRDWEGADRVESIEGVSTNGRCVIPVIGL